MNDDDLKTLMSELDNELSREKDASLSTKDKRLKEVARRLLELERDLSVPGAGGSDSSRQARIMESLEGEDF